MLTMAGRGRIGVVLLVAVAAGAAAYFASRAWLAADPSAPTSAAGSIAPAQAVIPERRPDVTLADRDGKLRSLAEWNGQPQVINFWATWCAPCREEIPGFVRLQKRHGARGLQLVGIAIDQPGKAADFAREFGINYPVLIGGMESLEPLRQSGNRQAGPPYTLVMDRGGKVVSRQLGGRKESRLEELVTPLL